MVKAIFNPHGAGSGSIQLDARAEIEGEIERPGERHGNRFGGVQIPDVGREQGLNFAARQKIPLHAQRGHRLPDGPLPAMAELAERAAVNDAVLVGEVIVAREDGAPDRRVSIQHYGRLGRLGLVDDSAAVGIAFQGER